MNEQRSDFVMIKDYKSFRKEFDYKDPNYSIYYKFFKRPISYPLTWIIYRYTNLRPNALTYIGFFFALIASFFFILGDWKSLIIGIVFFFIFELFDDFDGIIARSKNIRSRRGGWLDILAGYIGKFIILGSLSVGAFNATQNPLFLILGLVTVISFAALAEMDHVSKIRFSVVAQRKLKFEEHRPDHRTLGGALSIASEILGNAWQYLLLIACLTNRVPEFIIVSALYYLIYAIAQFFYLNWKYRNA
ncbi:MAG: CDP-alcohol phosphatidyltransferase family protein [Nanoarchaeota archaeon]